MQLGGGWVIKEINISEPRSAATQALQDVFIILGSAMSSCSTCYERGQGCLGEQDTRRFFPVAAEL